LPFALARFQKADLVKIVMPARCRTCKQAKLRGANELLGLFQDNALNLGGQIQGTGRQVESGGG